MFRPANDNAFDPNDPELDHSWDSPWNIDLLLMQAGFDPALIPLRRRRIAFDVASLWQNDTFDRYEIAKTLGEAEEEIRRVTKWLRRAGR